MQEAYATSLPAVIRGEEAFQAARRQKRNAALLGAAVVLVFLFVAAWISEAHPATLWAGLPRIGEYFIRILPDLRWDALFASAETEGSIAFWFYRLPEWALLILETANMAALATLLGSAVSLLLAFPAARNIAPSGLVYNLTRRFLEALRTIPEIVYALIFVWAFGVGALAGILAIALHSAGANGKLFAEAIENAEKRQAEGVTAAGGGRLLGIRFGLLPQVAPVMLAQALYFFESNTRSASILGVVGAGGIGLQIAERIRVRHWDEVAFIIILMIITVAAIDWISARIRRRLISA